MKMKRVLSILLAVSMIICTVPASIFAAPAYDDTQYHWAEEAINRWSEYSVVQGKGDGVFDPEGFMSRAEAAQVFANLLGLNKIADISEFDDVKDLWYKDAIAKCYAAGILNGKGNNKMDPDGRISREEFMTMYARAICISNGDEPEAAKTDLTQRGYTDTNKVSNWAADAVKTLVDKGFVKGISQTELAPKNNINRASVMALLNQSVSTYIGKNSTETTVAAKSEGITLIANPNVTKVTGNADVVVVAAGAEKYDETTGEIEHSDIKVESAKMPIARVEGENITVTLTINTEADDAEVTVTGVDSEIIVESTSSAKSVTLSAEGSKATVAGKVEVIKVEETAKTAVVDTKSTAKVETVENKAEDTTVKGDGTVAEVKSSENITIETKNTKVENTNEEKEIAVTDSKGKETKVETKAESTSTETSSTETTVNKEEEPPVEPYYPPTPVHTHTYSDVWSFDETHHWHAATCGHTEEVKGKAEHSYDPDTLLCECGKDSPSAVAKIDNVCFETLEAALTASKDNDTIILLKDIDQPANNVFLIFKKNITLDLNNKTISSGAIYTTDGTNLSDGKAYVFQGENFTIKNGTLAGCTQEAPGKYAYGAYIGFCTTGAIATSAVTLENVQMPSGGVNVADAKDVTVKNCTVTAAGAYYAVCVQTDSDKEPSVTIDGGTYVAGSNNNVVWVSSGAAMEIKAGTFTGDYLVDTNGTFSITGGTFDHNPSTYVATGYTSVVRGTTPETWKVDPMFAGGKGTKDAPYLVATEEQFMNLDDILDSAKSDIYFKFTADMDMSEESIQTQKGLTWSRLRWFNNVNSDSEDVFYTGKIHIDLNKHSINNLDCFLFDSVTNCELKNGTINFVNGTNESGFVYYIKVSQAIDLSFKDIVLNGQFDANMVHFGPLLAQAYGTSLDTNKIICDNVVSNVIINNVAGGAYTGGLLGYVSITTTIINSVFNGTIQSPLAGGFINPMNAGTYVNENNTFNGKLLATHTVQKFGHGNNVIANEGADAIASKVTVSTTLLSNNINMGDEIIIHHTDNSIDHYAVSILAWTNHATCGTVFNIEVPANSDECHSGIYKNYFKNTKTDSSTGDNRVNSGWYMGCIWREGDTYMVYSSDDTQINTKSLATIYVYGYDASGSLVTYQSQSYLPEK